MADRLATSLMLRYAALGLPLAFAGLPLYVHIPTFYAEHVEIPLTMLGIVLLVVRFLDAVIDPFIGYVSDRFWQHQRQIMLMALPCLLAGYVMLFSPPPDLSTEDAITWLIVSLAVVYTSFSVLMINFYASGTHFTSDTHGHTRVAAFRESGMLLGVLLASLLPAYLLKQHSVGEAYQLFSYVLAPLLVVCGALCIPILRQRKPAEHETREGFYSLLKNPYVRWVLVIGFCNAIPAAITSTLFMFYTADILKAPEHSGGMLVIYFLSAALGMPIWSMVSRKLGKAYCLVMAMCCAIISFIWAYGLGAGDVDAFYVICILSGMTVGADAMLLPSMLSDAIESQPSLRASAFGVWNLVTKLTMAFGAGMVLPFIGANGYIAGGQNSPEALSQLVFAYAMLPCILKGLAAAILFLSPLSPKKRAK